MKKRKWTRKEVEAWLDKNNRLFYFNREDGNLFFRKRCGINWGLNLGNPLAWAVMAGILLGITLSLVLPHVI